MARFPAPTMHDGLLQAVGRHVFVFDEVDLLAVLVRGVLQHLDLGDHWRVQLQLVREVAGIGHRVEAQRVPQISRLRPPNDHAFERV